MHVSYNEWILHKISYELTVLIYTVTYTKKQFTYKKKQVSVFASIRGNDWALTEN